MRLARTFVEMYHGKEAADEAEKHFVTVFQQRALPTDIPEKVVSKDTLEDGSIWIVKLLADLGLVPSNGEGRRMVQQGAVKINEEKVESVDDRIALEDGMVIQVGKRKFAKISLQ